MEGTANKFFINLSESHLGTTFPGDTWDKDIVGVDCINSFINIEDCLTLYAFIQEINLNKKLYFSLKISPEEELNRFVIYYKMKPTKLLDGDILSNIQITSMSGSPTLALYTSLNHLFLPLLQGDKVHLQKHVMNLQADLRSEMIKSHIDLDVSDTSDYNSLNIVQSLQLELEYWENVGNSSKSRTSRNSGAAFSELLRQVAKDFSIINDLHIMDVEDILENTHGILDDLWKHEYPFPKDHIIKIMDLIALDISEYTLQKLSNYKIWNDEYNIIYDIISQCMGLIDHWITTCKQLTHIFWPNYSPRPWPDKPYEPQSLVDLKIRLQEILNVRTLHKQLLKLLTLQEKNDLKCDEMFQPFKDINIFECGSFNNNWMKAQKKFEYLLEPAEQMIAYKLKRIIGSIHSNTRQLLYEFGRYSELISRPVLKQALIDERQLLLASLYDYMRNLQNQTGTEKFILSTKYDTPQIIKELIVTRQLESKTSEVQKISQQLLNDLEGCENLQHIVSEHLKDLKQQNNELFDSWNEEISTQIKNKSLSLKESDPVVQFSKNKLMRINYSPRLVMLISEVRQLAALGYHIPTHIEQISEHAKKFMKYAKTLEQIANFHNTIGDRMIISQRPMMLASAVELSKLVQEQQVVSWGDVKSVENYVETLKVAIDKLSRQNNLLAAYHYSILDKVKELEDVDLIRDYNKWKDATKQIRNIMSQVEDKGFKNMSAWKIEIDQQISKILEKQYVRGLDTLHLYLNEISADLVYRNLKLHFSPSEEELKQKYQDQLQKFIEIPKHFRGIADNVDKNIFAEIIERNEKELSVVDKHKDDLFNQLHDVMKHWESWLHLDPLDVSKLTSWQHWDLHFRASKTFGQEIAKLPSTEERVGCFCIGLARLRSDLESHNRSYWDQLIHSLKDSTAEDVVKLQNYIDPATATLTKQHVTVDEIGEAGASYANILKLFSEMEETYNQMMQKSQTLQSWSREQIDSVNRLHGAWERLKSLLENHQHIISKQMEFIKTTLNIENENLSKEVERYGAKWDQIKLKPHTGNILDSSFSDLHKQLESIKEKKSQWLEIAEKREKIRNDYIKYGMEMEDFAVYDEIAKDIENELKNWQSFEEFHTELDNLSSEEWIVFRKKNYRFEELLSSWQSKLKTVEASELSTRILQEINKYEAVIPILKNLRGEDFTEKHWLDVYNLLSIPPKSIEDLTLKNFLDVSENLIEHSKELQSICKKAASEIVVRQALTELDQWEVHTRFSLVDHTDSQKRTLKLVKDYKELLNKIGDNQSLLQSIKNSADYESFSERANLWENKLVDLDQYLTALSQIQRKWIYLEPIFGSGTLVEEKERFDKIDRDFRQILSYIEKNGRVVNLCRYQNMRSVLENLTNQLARCQHSLDKFLMEKRNMFPRFLFLGDDDLLEVVGQSSKEQVIQTHLKKLFAGINSIQLDESGTIIRCICSLHGEVVPLSSNVNINRPVEEWLNALVKEMQITLKELLVQCNKEGQPDPIRFPSQILCLADNINFTSKCEQAITSMNLAPLLATYKAQLSHYSSMEISDSDDNSLQVSNNFTDNEDSNVLELKLKALLLDTIHHIDVLEELLDNDVTKLTDWMWQKQLRFYSNSSGEVTLKMASARMEYAYEYLGNAAKLVRTPLTDRCFLNLTQGMHLGMGGNPYGPAGTGKTESVKALGGLLGRQVLVFNCDEGIDASSMGRILSGLVKTGAWGCFDEFNRLDEATLSAISMYIHPIQVALRTHQETVHLLDQEIKVNKHCGIFVTLNPAGGSYGGRNKLPDNLKQLFRPIVMTHPDHKEIAKHLLHCDGYQNADYIANKLIEIFSLSSKLLSKQQHYDWGLRAIKTIVMGCGRAMKKHRKQPELTGANMLEIELKLSVRVLRIDTLSKLTFSDSVKFDELVRDVFKGVSLDNMGNDVLIKGLQESFSDLGLLVNKRQVNKCLELYEQLKQRMGVAIVGPPSSGKSTLRNLLCHTLIKVGKIIKQHTFNPKSMPRTQLLGQIDIDTRQWNDGILTKYSIQVTSETLDTWSWIVCDGDIDPEWVESLNSVLDDNRLLSLPSGWRVQFGPNVNFIFETNNLSHASPATISRMGIVFLSEEDLNLEDYINNKVKKQANEKLETLIQDYYSRMMKWIKNEAELILPRSLVSVAATGLSLLEGVDNKSQYTVQVINSLCPQLQYPYRETFAEKVFDWTGSGEIPAAAILKTKYNKSRDIIETYYTNPNIQLNDIKSGLPLILTGQILQTLDILRVWLTLNNEQHFLIVGPHGSAKTLILEHLVKERSDNEIATIHCSANLMPDFVINKISQYSILVSTNRGKVYKPKKGHLVLYFKNLHLLKPDKWGTNILIEFLHQLITYKGFFDSNLEYMGIENITIVGSLIESNNLSIRFTSVVNLYSINLADHEDLSLIVVSYLTAILKKAFSGVSIPKQKILKLAATMISIYEQVKSAFSTIQYKHYMCSPHDLINWSSAILRYSDTDRDTDLDEFICEIICYEAIKLFEDKLTCDSDIEKLSNIINENFNKIWGKSNILNSLKNCYYVPESNCSNNIPNVNLVKLKKEDWALLVQKGITQYGRNGQNLDIIINDELLNLTASVSKVLSKEAGNIVLVGKSGIGRKSSVKIVSAIQSAKLIVPVSNNQPQFNNDLKQALQFAGLEFEQVYLLLEDHILSKDYILNIINVLISAGEVPGLYSSVELESLISGLKDESGRENFEGNLLQFFIERIKKKLHVVVCLDLDNENLPKIFENCPAFINNSRIIWRTNWSAELYKEMPDLIIDKLNERYEVKYKVKSCSKYSEMFDSNDLKPSAPSRFISMVHLYHEIYVAKTNSIIQNQNKLTAGVSKLTEARNLVASLKEDAAVQQEKLAEKQAKANNALDMISNTMKSANVHKEEMEILKQQTEKENIQLMKRKTEIEEELSEVEPLIQEARSAVGNIKSESLSEIRSLRAPPDIIRDILEGVLRLMGIQDTSWNSMKTFLAKRGVKEEIRSFDAGRITTDSRQGVEKLMTVKSDSFDPKSAKRASVAAAPLATWVAANVKYSKVLDKIKPLEREQNKLQHNLVDAENQLGELSAGLLDVDATVAKLKNQLSAYTKEAAEIEISLNKAQKTLTDAEGLVLKLNEEFERWQEQLKELSEELTELPMNALLASMFITYLSGECQDKRDAFLKNWMEKMGVNNFSIESFLSTEREHIQWQSEGLSYDQLSIQNAIIILKTKIVPLLIDPTSMAITWIKNHLKHKSFDTIAQNSPKFNTTLEHAVRFGKILIVEEIEEISPILYSVFRNEFVYQGERKLLYLNGKLIDYHNDFKLILSTRNEHLKLTADVLPVITIMNFTVTMAGLTEQLLSVAIRQENPEIEEKRMQLLREREELQEKQDHLQNQLLEELVNSTGDILQNTNLLASLNKTKASSIAITKALEESLVIQNKLIQEYSVYKDIASFGSLLYFAINEFSNFNILYTISVPAHTRLFLKSLQTSQVIENKLDLQKRYLFETIYNYTSRGIYKSDRVKFALHLVHNMYPGDIPIHQWNIFLCSYVAPSKVESDSLPPWIPKQLISNVQNLEISLPNLYETLKLKEQSLWMDFMKSNASENQFPQHCNSITQFEKVLVIQALRPDRLYSSMISCVLHLTNLNNLHPPLTDLSHVLKESVNLEPVLLLTTSGSDPSTEIRELALSQFGSSNFIEVAMGEGLESKALLALNETAESGHWLILKNLHLVTKWLPILCQRLQNLKLHDNFRLWLITEPHLQFSFVLAQNSLKISYETPKGIRNNLQHTYTFWGQKYFDKLNPNSARLFFVLACIHSLLQERRTYIPQGWSKWYEFNDTDFVTSVKLTEDLWQNASSQIQWKYISGLIYDAVYGGRIENINDMKILEAYLKKYLLDEVLSHRWKPFNLNISLPTSSRYQDYFNVILQFPNKDFPIYFGLPDNIDSALEKQVSSEIILHLKNLHLSKNLNLKFDREIWHKGLAPLMNLWKKINHGFDFVRMTIPEIENLDSPLQLFIMEEYRSGLHLIQKIHKTFAVLNKICKGFISPDDTDLAIGNSLLNYQVPKLWDNLWNGPKDPTKYLRSILSKEINISKLQEEPFDAILQKPINLSHFFHPESFLASYKLHISRKNNIPLDQLELKTSWEVVQDGSKIIITGLLMEGGLFNGSSLTPCAATSENINTTPDCAIIWKQMSSSDIRDEKYIDVPLYFTSNREKQLTTLQVSCNTSEKDNWILCGLAFYLEY